MQLRFALSTLVIVLPFLHAFLVDENVRVQAIANLAGCMAHSDTWDVIESRNCHSWTCVHGSILLVQARMYTAHVDMSCSLHSIESKETRGVKMFPTKTSRDVGMVDCVSDTTGIGMEKPTGEKSPGTRRCIPCLCNKTIVDEKQN